MADRYLSTRQKIFEELSRPVSDDDPGYVYVVTPWSMNLPGDYSGAFASRMDAKAYAERVEGVVHRMVLWPRGTRR